LAGKLTSRLVSRKARADLESAWQVFLSKRTEAGIRWDGTLVILGEMKHRFFMVVLIIAIVLAMTGWFYALGWVVLKLI
jgi:hypothetical protein